MDDDDVQELMRHKCWLNSAIRRFRQENVLDGDPPDEGEGKEGQFLGGEISKLSVPEAHRGGPGAVLFLEDPAPKGLHLPEAGRVNDHAAEDLPRRRHRARARQIRQWTHAARQQQVAGLRPGGPGGQCGAGHLVRVIEHRVSSG